MNDKNYMLRFILFSLIALHISLITTGCSSFFTRFIAKSFENLPSSPDTVASKIAHPIFKKIGLSVLWVGHATCLIQIEDKIFLTDPIFTETTGMISKRKIEPGILPSSIDKLDYILISHIHFDHLSYGSLSMLPKSAVMVLPAGGAEYTPEFGFSDYREMNSWTTFEVDGVRITAVPVKHFNGRYGFDGAWLSHNTFTGYVIEYKGKTVFFAGDTGYDPEKFKEIGKKFAVDVALIPIAPIEPHDFMKRVHADPEEALQIFDDVHAKIIIPIHHRTFVQGLDSSLMTAQNQLKQLITERHLEDRVLILNVGEQRILAP
ncbi:MAG: MBL fold metallo-hydrolase [Bacteroidota bacterium]|jgi:L-ascorbate metabolism protein UlaG (beta-lactamase superfamily)